MMGSNTVVHAAVASVLLLPTLSLTGDRATNLERSLEETLVALESLAGLRDELPARLQGPPEARRGTIGAVLGTTEGSITDARVRDTMLSTLRDDVGRLQMDLDRLRQKKHGLAGGSENTASATDNERRPLDDPHATGPTDGADQPRIIVPTVGLDSRQRAGLSDLGRPASAPVRSAGDGERVPLRIEADGFSADRLRQGHALYRADRFEEALAALEHAGDGAEPAYWRARCLERLERTDEALAAYEAIIVRVDTGAFAERARNDLEFLNWKREFGRRIDERGQEKGE